jgi:hypothetical protein
VGTPDGGGGGAPDGGGGGTPDGGGAGACDGVATPCLDASVSPETVSPGGNIEVTIVAFNFTLEDATGQPNQTSHGHYHVYLDDATGGNYEATGYDGSETITLGNQIGAGAHSFRISLTNNDHSPLDPNVEVVVPFTVQ